MEFIIILVIIVGIMEYTRRIDTKKFVGDIEPYFRFLMESDYKFLVALKYGDTVDANALYQIRVRNGVLTIVLGIFILFLTQINFVGVLLVVILGFVVFKAPYNTLQKYYRNNLARINQMLPYYLKSLEILIQHYTVPVALARSINSAPPIFKKGLQELVEKIEAGNSTIDPYMDFAKEYPVRDSMRMMRLLYRLSLGSQENKQQQLVMFSRSVSALQNKMREQKYKERLDSMEHRTMMMLFTTGGGILLITLFAMMTMMSI